MFAFASEILMTACGVVFLSSTLFATVDYAKMMRNILNDDFEICVKSKIHSNKMWPS